MSEFARGDEQFCRDLDWMIRCPSLVNSAFTLGPQPPDRTPDFAAVDRFLKTKASHRVGYYFESLVHVWLDSRPEISDIEQSIAIREEGKTLGELDFLFRKDGRLHHLEVALKFYLHCSAPNHTGSHFVGPNAADTFERKRDRLIGHQLPLGKKSRPEIEQSSLLVRGMIFYRVDRTTAEKLPDGMNPGHQRGFWIRRGELEGLSGMSFDRGTILQKPYWLAPPVGAAEFPVLEEQILSADPEKPLLISLGESVEGIYEERARMFVVPDIWPACAKDSPNPPPARTLGDVGNLGR